jgi:anti-sigma regulatory factor (Ser/Thr protein kinase)
MQSSRFITTPPVHWKHCGRRVNKSYNPNSRLTLRSQISELRLIPPWVEALASEHSISDKVLFAIDLCLEEALSNIIRHGYSGDPGHFIAVEFAVREGGELTFCVEDSAPPFNPLAPAAAGQPVSIAALDAGKAGGQGIRLLQRFANKLSYDQLPVGNRLTIGFLVE